MNLIEELPKHNNNFRLVVAPLSTDEKVAQLKYFYQQALPIRNRCQTVTPSEVVIIRFMVELYNSIMSGMGKTIRARGSACALPESLAKVKRFLEVTQKSPV